MNPDGTLIPESWETGDSEVMTADGNSVEIRVRGNGSQLVVKDGVTGARRTRVLNRVPRTVTRIIVNGRAGLISFEALRWMEQTGITFSVIDGYQPEVLSTNGTNEGDWRIIPQQLKGNAEAHTYLIGQKLRGQARVLDFMDSSPVARQLENMAHSVETELREDYDPDRVEGTEGNGAATYWSCWQGEIQVNWSPKDLVRIPRHWSAFPGRASMFLKGGENRRATDPVNAMLNYGYKVAETEVLRSCRKFGMHPDIGIKHAGGTDRHAFVLDMIEPLRPVVDELVVRLVRSQTYFSWNWVHETGQGVCVLNQPLTSRLCGWAADLGAYADQHAELVKGMLMRAS